MTRRRRIALSAAALAIVATLAAILWWPRADEPVSLPQVPASPQAPAPTSSSPVPAPSSTGPMPPLPTAPPSPTPTPSSLAEQECTHPEEEFAPTRFTIERVGAHERVMALPLQNGQVPSPPLDDRRSAAWWDGSPRAGADRGKSVLTIHTYRPSLRPALGNELYRDGASTLRVGDVIKLHGEDGAIACYEFTEAPRIFVRDYDPSSTVMLDPDGDPSLVIVICWDFNARTGDWDSRVMFQFDLMAP